MRSHTVAEAYHVHRLHGRVAEVRALLALAPRAGTQSWSGHDLRLWIELADAVTDEQIDSALTLATAWGAREGLHVAVAAHVVLVRVVPRGTDQESVRLRSHVDSVCAHLRSRMPGDLAKRLPRVPSGLPELSSAVIWAYFFACLSVLLFAIALTR